MYRGDRVWAIVAVVVLWLTVALRLLRDRRRRPASTGVLSSRWSSRAGWCCCSTPPRSGALLKHYTRGQAAPLRPRPALSRRDEEGEALTWPTSVRCPRRQRALPTSRPSRALVGQIVDSLLILVLVVASLFAPVYFGLAGGGKTALELRRQDLGRHGPDAGHAGRLGEARLHPRHGRRHHRLALRLHLLLRRLPAHRRRGDRLFRLRRPLLRQGISRRHRRTLRGKLDGK